MSQEKLRAKVKKARRKLGNSQCADCTMPDPSWASINLGIFLCIKCAGIHRSMGTHISKVKSISLDRWDANNVRTMFSVGNVRSNDIYLATCPDHIGLTEYASSFERDAFIRDKYQFRKFCVQERAQEEPDRRKLKRQVEQPQEEEPVFKGLNFVKNEPQVAREVPVVNPRPVVDDDQPSILLKRQNGRQQNASPWVSKVSARDVVSGWGQSSPAQRQPEPEPELWQEPALDVNVEVERPIARSIPAKPKQDVPDLFEFIDVDDSPQQEDSGFSFLQNPAQPEPVAQQQPAKPFDPFEDLLSPNLESSNKHEEPATFDPQVSAFSFL